MKLIDFNPKWLHKDGKRVGFCFISPANKEWRQSCFIVSGFSHGEQLKLCDGDAYV